VIADKRILPSLAANALHLLRMKAITGRPVRGSVSFRDSKGHDLDTNFGDIDQFYRIMETVFLLARVLELPARYCRGFFAVGQSAR
jgi:hypothetical protein